MEIKRHIPNAITCANLLCGCLAIVKAFEGDLVWAAYLVGIAAVLDFLDGFVARLLHVHSPIGKDLDSLADVVTFGVVPGVIIYQLFQLVLNNAQVSASDPAVVHENLLNRYLPYLGFIVPVFSGIRLAKFNNDPRQSDSFRGLPVPANAIMICSVPLLLQYSGNSIVWLMNSWGLSIGAIVLSFLLVSDIPLFSLKFKSFGWQDNKLRFWFLSLSAGILVAFQLLAIPLIIILYILLSIVNNIFSKKEV
ncbi:MAG: CDP-alcohol phosphatidyltransferase family protein [bacterium]|nr:CDP-alcohol phosphatidyltransferase family protein [bacterium]